MLFALADIFGLSFGAWALLNFLVGYELPGQDLVHLPMPVQLPNFPQPIMDNEKDYIYLDKSLVKLMEMRTEREDRFGVQTTETVYSWSGSKKNIPDFLHSLGTRSLTQRDGPAAMASYGQLLTKVLQERKGKPKLIIDAHIRSGDPLMVQPNKGDFCTWQTTRDELEARLPGILVLFAIHTVSADERIRVAKPPIQTGINALRWSSSFREHSFELFDGDGEVFPIIMV